MKAVDWKRPLTRSKMLALLVAIVQMWRVSTAEDKRRLRHDE
jgi:hypothetical protein